MDRNLILSILGTALLGFVGILMLMPDPVDDGVVRLPWQVSRDESGRTQVFGLTLGETTLDEVRQVFGEDGEMNLFRTAEEPVRFTVEAYFEQIYLQRLRADFVMTLEADQERLREMYERGLRISQLGSGGKKVKLAPEDTEALAAYPISSISYLPKATLDESLIAQRFGEPARRLTESETGIVHWLYPDRGLDIARDSRGHVVIQYVDAADFPALAEPLETAAAIAQ